MSLEEHLAALLGQVQPLEPLDITLAEAIGCQIVGDVVAPRPVPHFARCALNGYAVRSVDLTGTAQLKVTDDVRPGFAATQPVYAGVTVRVAAGTPVPAGADAVVAAAAVPVGHSVSITEQVSAGAGIHPVGGTAEQGAVVLPDGLVIDSIAVGLLAALGAMRVSVRPHPRVVVVTIGNELLPLGAEATAGLVFDAAGPMLSAAADRAGAVGYRVGPIPYEDRDIAMAVDDQLIRSDLVVVVGDTAADSRIRDQLATLGQVGFDEGSTNLGAFGHGVLGDERVPVLVLPRDPAAAALLFAALAVPLIAAMRGVPGPHPVSVPLGVDVPRTAQTQLLAARLESDAAVPLSLGAPTLVGLRAADLLLRVLPGAGIQRMGAQVLGLPLPS